MNDLLDRFAATLAPEDARVLSDEDRGGLMEAQPRNSWRKYGRHT